jgi:hypothetical protein
MIHLTKITCIMPLIGRSGTRARTVGRSLIDAHTRIKRPPWARRHESRTPCGGRARLAGNDDRHALGWRAAAQGPRSHVPAGPVGRPSRSSDLETGEIYLILTRPVNIGAVLDAEDG